MLWFVSPDIWSNLIIMMIKVRIGMMMRHHIKTPNDGDLGEQKGWGGYLLVMDYITLQHVMHYITLHYKFTTTMMRREGCGGAEGLRCQLEWTQRYLGKRYITHTSANHDHRHCHHRHRHHRHRHRHRHCHHQHSSYQQPLLPSPLGHVIAIIILKENIFIKIVTVKMNIEHPPGLGVGYSQALKPAADMLLYHPDCHSPSHV